MSARPPPITLNSSSQDILSELGGQRAGTPGRVLTPLSPTVSRAPSPFYQTASIADSSELLIPPRRGQFAPYQDSPTSSRRSSWSTDRGDSRYGPFSSPFDEGGSRTGSPDNMDALNSQTISEKYNITPSAGLLLFPIDKEDDDALHDPAEQDDFRECDIFTKRGLVNVGGLGLIVLGVLVLFIGYPVLYVTFFYRYLYQSPVAKSWVSIPGRLFEMPWKPQKVYATGLFAWMLVQSHC